MRAASRSLPARLYPYAEVPNRAECNQSVRPAAATNALAGRPRDGPAVHSFESFAAPSASDRARLNSAIVCADGAAINLSESVR